MKYLILSIVLHVYIFTSFRMFKLKNVHTLSAIVVNYWVCVGTGFVFYALGRNLGWVPEEVAAAPFFPDWGGWGYFGLLLGFFFVSIFYLMAITTQRLTVAVASTASKMSLVLPVLFSLLVLQIGLETFDLWNIAGLVLAFLSIALTSYQGKSKELPDKPLSTNLWILPFAVFLGSGAIDIILNYANNHHVTPETEPLFPIVSFGSAAVAGTVISLVQRVKLRMRNVVAGILLGVPNYFSIFFVLMALSSMDNNGAVVFPIINIGVIMLSSLAGVVLFRERLSAINLLGLLAAASSIVLISYQALQSGFLNM